MRGKWTWNAERKVWQARVYLPEGNLSEVFAEVDRTHLGWHWLRWPTLHVPYSPSFTNSGIEPTRERAMEVALVEVERG